MTAMEQALKKAGVKLTVNQRVWQAVKDKPDLIAARYAAIVGIGVRDASSVLSGLKARQMVETSTQRVRGKAGKGFTTRDLLIYRVPVKMVQYEVLPRVVKAVPRKPKVKQAEWPAAPAAPAPAAPVAPAEALASPQPPQAAKVFPGLGVMGRPGPELVYGPNTLQPPQRLPPSFTPGPVVPPNRTDIDQWPLAEARKVYDYLKTMFAS